MSTPLTRQMVLAAVSACEEKKAENIRVLELDPADSAFTDFFLICSGANSRQNQAIAQEIEMRMKREFATYANSVEGYRQGEWILVDYVDFVVHIFGVEQRASYDIERLRKTAHSMSVEELKESLTEKTIAARKKADAAGERAKKPAAVGKKTLLAKKTAKKAAKKISKTAVKKGSAGKGMSVRAAAKKAASTKKASSAKKAVAAKKSTARKIVKKAAASPRKKVVASQKSVASKGAAKKSAKKLAKKTAKKK
jgi:ribosome-associated protein